MTIKGWWRVDGRMAKSTRWSKAGYFRTQEDALKFTEECATANARKAGSMWHETRMAFEPEPTP